MHATLSYTSNNLHETENLGIAIARSLRKRATPCIVFFEGPFGAGKTTLIKTIISQLTHVRKESISSPTFQYVSLYQREDSVDPIAHFDLWRLPSCDSFFSLGLEDIVSSSCSFIEWPEKLGNAHVEASMVIRIEAPSEEKRVFVIEDKAGIFTTSLENL